MTYEYTEHTTSGLNEQKKNQATNHFISIGELAASALQTANLLLPVDPPSGTICGCTRIETIGEAKCKNLFSFLFLEASDKI